MQDKTGMSRCNKCNAEYPSAPVGVIHKCGACSGGYCSPIMQDKTTDAERRAEQCVMSCPQCEGEGGYPDGLDEAACHTECTRCGSNGWIVDLASFDHGESKCDASCLNCAGSGQVAVMTGTRRDIVAYYTPCPNGPAPDVATAAWGLIDAVEGGDSIPRACGILRWALVAESEA